MGLAYGSYDEYPPTCSLYGLADNCSFHETITFGFKMCYFWSSLIYALSWVILALVSPIAKQILGSAPIQFLGKISYSLYLIHLFIVITFSLELVKYLVLSCDWEFNYAVYFAYFNTIPVVFLLSWILTELFDLPSKDFANEFD